MDRKFYDIHYHLFDLSHPNLIAFLLRDDLISKNSVRKLMLKFPFIIKLLPLWMLFLAPAKAAIRIKKYISTDARNFRNLLSVIEGAIEYHFLYTEYFLLKGNKYFGNKSGAKYNKIVLSPLLMDFGYKNLRNEDCFYNLPPSKPIMNQVVDLFNAVWFYYNYDLIIHPEKEGRLKLVPTSIPKEEKLFEIYPFLGINTQNYDLREIVALFDKYFRGYEEDVDPAVRQKKLSDKLGTVRIDLEEMIFKKKEQADSDYYTYLFAGIKLYPPLGFDPWPEENDSELEKVRFLYSECIRRNIPITVHCSDRGFITSPDAYELTDPSKRWKEVLLRPEFKDLRINFAHLGTQHNDKKEWQNTILNYFETNRSVYTDCSCQTPYKADYEKVMKIMNSDNESRILFGSDYVINLIWSESYNEYLYNFIQTNHLDDRQKELMCEINPKRFLFG